MAQWGNNDVYTNSVMWAVTGFNGTPNTGVGSNRQNFFDNNTADAYIPGLTVGQWGVDPSEMAIGNGPVNLVTITFAGSGYSSTGGNTTSVISGGGGSGANATFTASSSGRLSSFTINNGGSSYETNPTITVNPPQHIVFNGNTAIHANSGSIVLASANSKFLVGDRLTFAGNVSSRPVGLADQTQYYVVLANTTVIQLSTTNGGSAIALTGAPYASAIAGGATLQGETATASAVVGGAQNKGVTHAGWVVRKVGSGGRAGRVQYETLVAMGSISTDASDDTVLPDA